MIASLAAQEVYRFSQAFAENFNGRLCLARILIGKVVRHMTPMAMLAVQDMVIKATSMFRHFLLSAKNYNYRATSHLLVTRRAGPLELDGVFGE